MTTCSKGIVSELQQSHGRHPYECNADDLHIDTKRASDLQILQPDIQSKVPLEQSQLDT